MTTTLADNIRFLRALIARPKDVGAVMPSSPALAEAIARQIDSTTGPVLETGPGTGVISQAVLARGIPADQLTLVEYDEELAQHLARRFPQAHVIQGDAFDLDRTLGARHGGPFCAIVSGIPLLNHSMAMRLAYMDGLVKRLMPGAPIIQFSYGPHAPVVPPDGYRAVHVATVFANIPPAKVWVYRKI
ncbi:MAG TPA: rRNA adenine N-6-methyltransferase family protein [Rhizomicrobium sp.]|nr:rRNA adenine N-6-methyltransferase family protein [Rhizomicrobium sp.]